MYTNFFCVGFRSRLLKSSCQTKRIKNKVYDYFNINTNIEAPISGGGKTDKFTWIQDISTVSMYIDVPQETKAKMIDVIFKKKELVVGFKGEEPILKVRCLVNFNLKRENYRKKLDQKIVIGN